MPRKVTEGGRTFGFDEGECRVLVAGGQQYIVFPSFNDSPRGVDYVRFVDVMTEEERLYYVFTEWVEDPELVMGVIMACIQHGAIDMPSRAQMNERRSNL